MALLGGISAGQGQGTVWGGFVEAYYKWVGQLSVIIRYDVSDGSKICFWHDLWNGENTLNERYPNLFLIARDREAIVANYIEYRKNIIIKILYLLEKRRTWLRSRIYGKIKELYLWNKVLTWGGK